MTMEQRFGIPRSVLAGLANHQAGAHRLPLRTVDPYALEASRKPAGQTERAPDGHLESQSPKMTTVGVWQEAHLQGLKRR